MSPPANRPEPKEPTLLLRLRQSVATALTAPWCALGLGLPLVLALRPPALDGLLLAAGCALLTAAFAGLRLQFRHRDAQIEISPAAASVVLAALLLPAPQAATVALVGAAWAARKEGRWQLLFAAGNASLAAGLASVAAHHLVADHATGRLVLSAAFVAAAVKETVSLAGIVLFEEARAGGSGTELVRNTPTAAIFLLDFGLALAAVCTAGPFLASPLQAFAIVALAQGFAYLALRQLREQHRQRQQNAFLRQAFSRYMPSPVANQLMTSGREVELGGEQREISVLFCDVRGFTSWAEQHQPDDVIGELNRLLTAIAQAVLSTDGTIDKFTGDGLMAFWGAPTDQPDHAVRAVRAVAEMMRRVNAVNARRAQQGKQPFDIGVGINTGLAMVGNVGHHDRLNYTAVGDTVNTASRIESATKQLDVPMLLSESTFLAMPLALQKRCARMESISVKGRRDRVRLYTLVQLAALRGPANDWHLPPPDAAGSGELPATGSD